MLEEILQSAQSRCLPTETETLNEVNILQATIDSSAHLDLYL